jgi:hypothetical protein
MSTNNFNIDWTDVIKREARGSDGYDFGEVQEVSTDYVVTEKGLVDKTKYILPKSLALKYDRDCLYFHISEAGAKRTKNNIN